MLRCFLGFETPPDVDQKPIPKNKLEGERDNQIKVIPSNHNNNNEQAGYMNLSRGLGTLLRSAYVLVVKVTMKVGISFASLPTTKVNLSYSL